MGLPIAAAILHVAWDNLRTYLALTDEPVPVVAVSRSGVDCPGLDAAYGPGDLLTAWPP